MVGSYRRGENETSEGLEGQCEVLEEYFDVSETESQRGKECVEKLLSKAVL